MLLKAPVKIHRKADFESTRIMLGFELDEVEEPDIIRAEGSQRRAGSVRLPSFLNLRAN
jgi:hypothetical protein